MKKQTKDILSIIMAVASMPVYAYLAYFLQREQTLYLISTYIFLFASFLWTYFNTEEKHLKLWIGAGVTYRLLLIFALPNLSDDFYRFVWDGRLIAHNINPFLALPSFYMQEGNFVPGLTVYLYEHLNSPEYFTIYPPICQLVFYLAALVSPESIQGSVITMRLILLAAEIGSIILLWQLLKVYSLPLQNIVLYVLNPLVVLELVGNLHFEVLMIFFLLLFLALWNKGYFKLSAIALGMAIGVKLLPLIILPLLIRRLGLRKAIIYFGIVALTVVFLFLPFLSKELFIAIGSSSALYFRKFEFNGGIYYLIREIGYWFFGFNIIWVSGIVMGLSAFAGIIYFSGWEKLHPKTLPEAMLWVWTIYLAFAIILHPWYITPLIALSCLARYRFPIVWTLLIFLTYSAYQPEGVKEHMGIIALEYLVVVGMFIYELFIYNKKKKVIFMQP